MIKTRRETSFIPDVDVDLYLSIIDPSKHSDFINLAIENSMINTAVIDLAEGKEPVDFWSLLYREKVAICRLFSGRYGEPPYDEKLWNLLAATSVKDFYVIAAKYLTLHRLVYNQPFRMPQGWRETTRTKPKADKKPSR